MSERARRQGREVETKDQQPPTTAVPPNSTAPMNRHLLTIWNPSYTTDALHSHVGVLLDWESRSSAGQATDDDVFVWWGKVRSGNRQAPMPHLAEVLAIDASVGADDDSETHLYLTDYRSLFVADIGHITTTDPRTTDGGHVPKYYSDENLNCDCWFHLSDIRSLVRDDLEAVIAELIKLRNTRYNDRPVSLYGGMVDLPLIVSRPDERQFFGEAERDQLANGELWARFDSQQTGVSALEATLRDDHFGNRAWQALDVTARRFIASGERVLRENRRDRWADLSQVIVGYAKAIEVQANLTLREAARSAPDAARRVKIGDSTHMLPECLPLSLGALAKVLRGEEQLVKHLSTALEYGPWFTAEFAAFIDEFAKVRNSSAHGERMESARVIEWRDRLLGVGCESVMGKLAGVRVRSSRINPGGRASTETIRGS